MNFQLTEEQNMLREMVREFAENEIRPQARILEESRTFPEELLKKMADLGILGMTVPSEYEGYQVDTLSVALALEEISRALPSLAVILSVHTSLFCYSINNFGTEFQKKRYLPAAARGDIIGAFSLTEPEAGSDAANLKSVARKKGDRYVLNGTKAWVTSGKTAGAVIIFTQTETVKDKKISAFIVDKDSSGFQVSKIEDKMGLNSSLTAEITLEDCEVPEENRLGQEGEGLHIALHGLDLSRIGIAAQSVGLAQRSLEEAVEYARQRKAFGKNISQFQAVQFMLADIAVLAEAARLLTHRAACRFDKGLPYAQESAMAKLFASEAANKIAYKALQVHGGYGYSKEFFIEQLYRDARVLPIYEGTSEIQRVIISRHLLNEGPSQ
ncbi:MAG: acyl-CoA dehydrogenase family protein [Candidatus Aminicenantes bacterium]